MHSLQSESRYHPGAHEEEYIGQCLESVRAAERKAAGLWKLCGVNRAQIERGDFREHGATIVHEDARKLSRIRMPEFGSKGSSSSPSMRDSWMSANMLAEVSGDSPRAGMWWWRSHQARNVCPLAFLQHDDLCPRLLLDRSWAGCSGRDVSTLTRSAVQRRSLVSAEDVAFAKRSGRLG